MRVNKSIKGLVSAAKGSQVLLVTALAFVAMEYIVRGLVMLHVPISMPVSMVLSQGLVLVCGIAGVWYCGYDSERDLKIDPVDGFNLLLVVFAVICCYPIVAFLNLISMQFVPNAIQEVAGEMFAYGLGPSLILMAVCPAIGEELLMRGIVYRSYKKASPVAAMVFSALFFGMMHMNFNQMPYAFFLGIVMVLINEAADSMAMSMVLHLLFNGSNTVLNYYASGMITDEEMTEATELVSHMNTGMIIGYGVVAFVMCLLLVVVIRAMYKHNQRTLRMAFGCEREGRLYDRWFVILFIVLVLCMIRSLLI